MPAEWSPHAATWISWPRNPETWPGVLEQAELAMVEVVAALAPGEHIHINVQDAAHQRHVAGRLAARVPPERISLEAIPTDDAWIRDYGAIIVANTDAAAGESGGWAALDFGYNAWGGKYPPWDNDLDVARRMAERLGLPRIERSLILEGGSVDVNGQGQGLVTEECLLNPNRNPGLGRDDIEAVLKPSFGLEDVIWLGSGIAGDDTDGHIDNLARFVAADRVVVVTSRDADDPNHAALADNLARLEAWREQASTGLTISELPLPDPVVHRGVRLPASYANFYIANNIVLVPVYAVSTDAEALEILADCFIGRRIVPIDCRALIVGLGALHCLTQQIPVMVADPAPK